MCKEWKETCNWERKPKPKSNAFDVDIVSQTILCIALMLTVRLCLYWLCNIITTIISIIVIFSHHYIFDIISHCHHHVNTTLAEHIHRKIIRETNRRPTKKHLSAWIVEKLCLNEIFTSKTDSNCTSQYKIEKAPFPQLLWMEAMIIENVEIIAYWSRLS